VQAELWGEAAAVAPASAEVLSVAVSAEALAVA